MSDLEELNRWAGKGMLNQREVRERNRLRHKEEDRLIVTNAGTKILIKHDGRNYSAWRVEANGELTNMRKGSGKVEPLIDYLMRKC